MGSKCGWVPAAYLQPTDGSIEENVSKSLSSNASSTGKVMHE